MNIRNWALAAAALALISISFIHEARADVYWETRTTITNVLHNRNRTSIQKYYLTGRSFRLELEDKKIYILNYDTLLLYRLDPKQKKFTVHDLHKLGWFSAKVFAALADLRTDWTGELKTISSYTCHQRNVHMAIVNGEWWTSDEVKGYEEARGLAERMGVAIERSPLFSRIDLAGFFHRLDGFPVHTVNLVLGGRVVTDLTKIEQKYLDPDLFVVPKDYRLAKMNLAKLLPDAGN